MIKKIFIFILISFFFAATALAQDAPCTTPANSTTLCNPVGNISADFPGLIKNFFAFFALSTGAFTVVYLSFAGFRFMVSQGESEKLEKAKEAFTWPIYGMILSILSFAIVVAINEFLGAKNPDPSAIQNKDLLNPLQDENFYSLVIRMLKNFLAAAGLIAILMILISGLRYITSSGSEELTTQAKKTLQWAILGFIIIILAYVITSAVGTFFS